MTEREPDGCLCCGGTITWDGDCGDCGCRPEWYGRSPFAVGQRVRIHEVPGGYIVWPATEDES